MNTSHWQQYWKQPVVSSFGESEPGWFHQILVPFWQELISVLPDGASMLDVATGNGAVTRIACEIRQRSGKDFQIHAQDRVETSAVEGVQILPPGPLESFVTDHRYSLVTAQFGLEYSRLDRSIPAISRTIEPGGQLAIIAHHVDSRISHFSREEIRQYRAIFQQQDLFAKLERLLRVMGDTRTTRQRQQLAANPKAQAARKAINRSIAQLTGHFPEGIVIANLLKQINPLFQQMMNLPAEKKLAYLASIEKDLRLARMRLADQLDAALDDRDRLKLESLAISAGLEPVETTVLEDREGHLLAWKLILRRKS